MDDNRMKLTTTKVGKLEPIEGKQRLVWDTELRGFGVRIAPGGMRSYIMQRRVGNKERRVTLGRHGEITAENARRKALGMAAQFSEGFDPVKERQKKEARDTTLREAFNAYKVAPKRRGNGRGAPKKAQTIRDIDKAMRRFEDWLDLSVTDITGRMVKDRHAKLAAVSPAQANLAFRYLRAAFNLVIADSDDDEEPILMRNPVDRLNRLAQWAEVKPSKDHLPEDRVAEWLDAVRTALVGMRCEAESRDALIFMLLTGARIGEVLGNVKDGYPPLRWSDVDLKDRIVTFRNTKNGTDHELPLSSQLVDLLKERKKIAGVEYVFSDAAGEVPADLRNALRRMETATGLHLTAHDLRRSFATIASKLDVSAYKLKRLTNHISGGDVTAGYVQVTTDDLRDAMQRISDYLLSPARTGDVIQFSEARTNA
jgi:integrase